MKRRKVLIFKLFTQFCEWYSKMKVRFNNLKLAYIRYTANKTAVKVEVVY